MRWILLCALLALRCSDNGPSDDGAAGDGGVGASSGESAGGMPNGGADDGGTSSGGTSSGGTHSGGAIGDAGETGDAGGGGGDPSDLELEPNDVSVLFPLVGSAEGMYRPSDATAHGALLPLAMFDTVGPIASIPAPGGAIGASVPEPVADTYPRLRVVALRVDPCFPKLGGESCRSQVRLVVQPIKNGDFEDCALHVFYDVPSEDFDGLVRELRALKARARVASSGPLRVHPILKEEGPSGTFAKGLQKAIYAVIGADRVTRVTAMQVDDSVFVWTFRGFDFAGGVGSPIGILGTGGIQQSFHDFAGDGFGATVTPIFDADKALEPAWTSRTLREATSSVQQTAFQSALQLENPTLVDAESASCVACHTAGSARLWSERELGLDASEFTELYQSSFDLNLTVDPEVNPGARRLRAFGYLHTTPIFSQRTVNESAAVAAALAKPR